MKIRDLPDLGNTKKRKLRADGYAFSSDSLIVRSTKEEAQEDVQRLEKTQLREKEKKN